MSFCEESAMRRFHSCGPIIPGTHFYAPREELVENTYIRLFGENSGIGGHYITVWAPRQSGKTWLMIQILRKMANDPEYHVVKVDLEFLKEETDAVQVASYIADEVCMELEKAKIKIDSLKAFQELFSTAILDKPLILILDEFDALDDEVINNVVGVFRNIYHARRNEQIKPPKERRYALHGLALIGVRSVLGNENNEGAPFNVQRSLHVPNFSFEEVESLFQWYEKESGQTVESAVVERLFDVTRGQPGFTCWFGELLTETYNEEKGSPITLSHFDQVYAAARDVLLGNLKLIKNSNVRFFPSKKERGQVKPVRDGLPNANF